MVFDPQALSAADLVPSWSFWLALYCVLAVALDVAMRAKP